MAGVPRPDGDDWETWFESGDPFMPYDDGEATKTAHLLRHGVDIGEAVKRAAGVGRSLGRSFVRSRRRTTDERTDARSFPFLGWAPSSGA